MYMLVKESRDVFARMTENDVCEPFFSRRNQHVKSFGWPWGDKLEQHMLEWALFKCFVLLRNWWNITVIHWALSSHYHFFSSVYCLLLNCLWLGWTGTWHFLRAMVWQQNVSFHCITVSFVRGTCYAPSWNYECFLF